MNILELKDIDVTIKNNKVLQGLNMEFVKGEFTAIMGGSGSGKTTTLNVASGLLKPESGQVIYKGQDISKVKEPKITKLRAKEFSFIFQDYSLIEYLTVFENIKFTAHLSKTVLSKKQINEMIKAVGLEGHEKSLPSKLSGGQMQRVAIARSLLLDADVIFADEPTGALDLITKKEVMKLFTSLVKEKGKSLIMITHDPEAASFADAVNFIVKGKVKRTLRGGTAKELASTLIDLEVKNV